MPGKKGFEGKMGKAVDKLPRGRDFTSLVTIAPGANSESKLAGISIDVSGHIFKGYTKLNDSYFSLAYYNTPDWKQSVTCQELGHNVGLDHQDEDFNNTSLASCMDYQDPPFPYANAHDFEQLESIYAHADSYADIDENADADGDKYPHTHPYVDGHSNSYADGYSYANTDKHTHVHRHGHANANGYGHVNADGHAHGDQHYQADARAAGEYIQRCSGLPRCHTDAPAGPRHARRSRCVHRVDDEHGAI